jgi:hypothetical protein
VPVEKLSGYALNSNHAQGGDKARVFQATLGMDASYAPDLETQVRDGIKTNSAIPGDVDELGYATRLMFRWSDRKGRLRYDHLGSTGRILKNRASRAYG